MGSRTDTVPAPAGRRFPSLFTSRAYFNVLHPTRRRTPARTVRGARGGGGGVAATGRPQSQDGGEAGRPWRLKWRLLFSSERITDLIEGFRQFCVALSHEEYSALPRRLAPDFSSRKKLHRELQQLDESTY